MRNALIAVCALPVAAFGQADAHLLNDRANDSVWQIHDANGNGVINEPGEVRLWFSAANAPGTIGPDNPTALAVRGDGYAAMGDQGIAAVLGLRDLNGDADALDAGESLVVADASNASGAVLSFPAGVAFDLAGVLYVSNPGNAFGPDAVYRLEDLNSDGDCQDAGEITEWVGAGAFGPGNGPWSPQEMVFVPGLFPIGLLRNSSPGLHGVYRFLDLNGNGRADDAGEFTVYFDAANGSGITPAAGFALERDLANAGSIYILQTASGGVDQLIRLTDKDGDSAAQSAGEAVVAFETNEAGFTGVDVVSAADGRVFLSDNSGKRVIVLRDNDTDGLFMSAGERADYYVSGGAQVGDIRQLAPIAAPAVACYADCNGDGALNLSDFGCFTTKFALGDPYADCNGDGVRNLADFGCFTTKFALGCP
ncbi:MAG: hypothetical protein IT437_11175 [Phycisphaerales bacterium]|nr:hypothetical protein [Phycisphaerales bacterium]